jgi:hypothetical protein
MLYLVWVPADPDAAAALVPPELEAALGSPVFMNQYIVDDAVQTSNAATDEGFGAYSLTYLGIDLAGLDTEDGTPARWWTHYFDSSPNMIRYAAAHGVPAGEGETKLELSAGKLVATTTLEGKDAIRTTARVELGNTARATGQLRYLTRVDGRIVSGRYPFVMDAAEKFDVRSVEFLGPGPESLLALRPGEPLDVSFGFYSPWISFCYPGGEGPLNSEHGS